ncbi:MAG: oxidoreductase [Planctomycetota bacterium]
MSESRPQRFSGRRVLVTGAASGIGLATARRLLDEGARVAMADVRAIESSAGADLDSRVGAPGADPGPPGRVLPLLLDVTREVQWTAAMHAIESRFGGLDILVQCAGITGIDRPQNPDQVSLDDWRRVFAVNLDGAMLGSQAALPLLRKGTRPAIVIVASLAGRLAAPGAAAYAASKAALASFSRSLALHAAADPPIRVNCVLPGPIETPMWDAFLGHGADRAAKMAGVAADVPLRRFGRADEVAAAIAFLASDEGAFITGAELVIDGGQSLRS